MSESNIFGNKWIPIEQTTPSGKAQYRCSVCGAEDPAPTKYHDCRLKLTADENADFRAELEAAKAEIERLKESLELARVVFQGLANTRAHPTIHSLQQWAKSWLAIDARKGSLSVKQFLAECEKEEKSDV